LLPGLDRERRKQMTLPFFSNYHCVHCGFVGRAKLSTTGKGLTALWLLLLVAGIVFWPLLILWAGATVAAVLVFEKLCCCPSCNQKDAAAMPRAQA